MQKLKNKKTNEAIHDRFVLATFEGSTREEEVFLTIGKQSILELFSNIILYNICYI